MLGGLLGQQKEMFESMLETTVAHEVGHQWWAMAVGSDSQRTPFVDESLTNYTAMLYYEDRYGATAAQKMIDLNLKTIYSMGRMLGGGDAPVNLSTSAYTNNMQYGAVVYGKGALYYEALRKLIGDQSFFSALKTYYSRYNLKLAPAKGLLQIVKEQSPGKAAQADALYKRWIEEKHGDDDITGGPATSIGDLLGGLLGGMAGGDE
jgi:aminopeptidase N